ncbi:MAG TPA: hypothetical protein VMW16_04150 [Sedimentisphaerales bacterium]|nr:hypothetical protein [Sedimentisphaerales bacterium]
MPVLSEDWKMRPRYNWYSRLIRKYYKISVGLTKPRHPIPDKDIAGKAEREKRLVIQIPFGGLGDHLAYSSLPELLWKQKGIRTFVSNKSIFRSRAIREFVWEINPYIQFTNERGWFIHNPLEEGIVIDDYVQKLFRLKGNGLPKTYYQPQKVEQIDGKNVVDASFGPTGRANGYYEAEFHERFVAFLKDNVRDFVLLTHGDSPVRNELEGKIIGVFEPAFYNVGKIEELADVLFSAENRYLLHSGAASLSAALGLQSNILNYVKPSSYNAYRYRVNNYIDLKATE